MLDTPCKQVAHVVSKYNEQKEIAKALLRSQRVDQRRQLEELRKKQIRRKRKLPRKLEMSRRILLAYKTRSQSERRLETIKEETEDDIFNDDL